jgi:hypothetical protein
MHVFIDFEASSLGKESYPIEVGWVFVDGRSEGHLIRPAPDWHDWSADAEAIHRIPRATLERDGVPHEQVAARMIEVLGLHDLFASAPSWDGKWLSVLLRAAGLPRHALRLRDTEEAHGEIARALLAPLLLPDALEGAVANVVSLAELRFRDGPVAHRAVEDAERERQRWMAVRAVAADLAGIPLPPSATDDQIT